VLRILFMVPIYAMESWLGLKFRQAAEVLDTLRLSYESLVIYSFFSLLVGFLGGERHLARILRAKPQQRHVFPFCCVKPWEMGQPFSSSFGC